MLAILASRQDLKHGLRIQVRNIIGSAQKERPFHHWYHTPTTTPTEPMNRPHKAHTKAGVNILGDSQKLHRDYGVKMNGIQELSVAIFDKFSSRVCRGYVCAAWVFRVSDEEAWKLHTFSYI